MSKSPSIEASESGIRPDHPAMRPQHNDHALPLEPAGEHAPVMATGEYRVAYPLGSVMEAQRRFSGTTATGLVYSRLAEPHVMALENAIAARAGGSACVATGCGMSAELLVFLTLCRRGDHIIAVDGLYGGTYALLKHTLRKLGVAVTFVARNDIRALKRAMRRRTRVVFAETLANPMLVTLDIAAYAAAAHSYGVPLAVDNTQLSWELCRSLTHGADLCVHSLTKWLGEGERLGGCVIEKGDFPWDNGRHRDFTEPDPAYEGLIYSQLPAPMNAFPFAWKARLQIMRDCGLILSPRDAAAMSRALVSLPARVRRQSESARQVALYLQSHPGVERVVYPGLDAESADLMARYHPEGGSVMLSAVLRGGLTATERFFNALAAAERCVVHHQVSFGGPETAVICPALTTHMQVDPAIRRAQGLEDGLLRLSVGLDDAERIISDLDVLLRKLA